MKSLFFTVFCLVAFGICNFGQLKVVSSGNTIIGPVTTWYDYKLNLTGSGANGSEGILSFGNNSTATKNVLVGEYGTGDTDVLLLHGNNGIRFSTTGSLNTKMYLLENGNTIIGPVTTWYDYKLNLTGTGANGSEGILAFGNNSTATKNVLVGEYGTGDTDVLLLHGNNGIRFSTTGSLSTKAFLLENGNLGIGTETPSTIGSYDKVLDVRGPASAKISATTTTDAITCSLMTSSYGDWGAVGTESNHKLLFMANNIPKIEIQPSGEVRILDYLRLGSFSNRIRFHTTGAYGSANGFDFNTSSGNPGIIIEQGAVESSGFYADGSYAVIWSPGKQDRLLRVYDEDGMVEKWYLDDDGVPHTSSDLNRKENINNITNVTSKLITIRGVSFNFIAEDHSGSRISDLDSLSGNYETAIDSALMNKKGVDDIEETKPLDKYFGFIAQEVEAVFPELVSTDENGQKFVSYTEFIPLLVEAFKEQQQTITIMQEQIDFLRNEFSELKSVKITSY